MITDASIAATLLWAELRELADIHGPAHHTRIYEIGQWTLTANPTEHCVYVCHDDGHAGIIGPGETTDLAPELARALRRDLHEHVYQFRRSHP